MMIRAALAFLLVAVTISAAPLPAPQLVAFCATNEVLAYGTVDLRTGAWTPLVLASELSQYAPSGGSVIVSGTTTLYSVIQVGGRNPGKPLIASIYSGGVSVQPLPPATAVFSIASYGATLLSLFSLGPNAQTASFGVLNPCTPFSTLSAGHPGKTHRSTTHTYTTYTQASSTYTQQCAESATPATYASLHKNLLVEIATIIL